MICNLIIGNIDGAKERHEIDDRSQTVLGATVSTRAHSKKPSVRPLCVKEIDGADVTPETLAKMQQEDDTLKE